MPGTPWGAKASLASLGKGSWDPGRRGGGRGGAAGLRVPAAPAASRSAHSRALLAAAARGRRGDAARPPCGAGGRAPGCEVSEAPHRRVSRFADRVRRSRGGRVRRRCRPGTAAWVGATAHRTAAAAAAAAPRAGLPVGCIRGPCSVASAHAWSREAGTPPSWCVEEGVPQKHETTVSA